MRIVEQDGRPLSVGRKTRTIPIHIRRALEARDHGCRFPGCHQTRGVDAHHIHHWAQGGSTEMDNLVLLCRYHHRLIHEGGFGVGRSRGNVLTFHAPDGKRIVHSPRLPRGSHATLFERNDRSGISISPNTCRPRDPGRMNLDGCIGRLERITSTHSIGV